MLVKRRLLGRLGCHDIRGALSLASTPLCTLIRQMLLPEGTRAIWGKTVSSVPALLSQEQMSDGAARPCRLHLRFPAFHIFGLVIVVVVASIGRHVRNGAAE